MSTNPHLKTTKPSPQEEEQSWIESQERMLKMSGSLRLSEEGREKVLAQLQAGFANFDPSSEPPEFVLEGASSMPVAPC